jgi:hypothetical protein
MNPSGGLQAPAIYNCVAGRTLLAGDSSFCGADIEC